MGNEDYKFMLQAIEQAKRARDDYGRVGSVLVQHGKLISAAGSSSFRYPVLHAEHAALEKVGWLNKYSLKTGSIIYVTLQPCIKRTNGANGCSFDIVNSGIERVVYGCLDPNLDIDESIEFFGSRGIILEQIPNTDLQKECWNIFYQNNKNINK